MPDPRQIVPEDGAFQEGDRLIFEECSSINAIRSKPATLGGVHYKKVLRERAGQEGTEGLTDLQRKIYELIVSSEGAALGSLLIAGAEERRDRQKGGEKVVFDLLRIASVYPRHRSHLVPGL